MSAKTEAAQGGDVVDLCGRELEAGGFGFEAVFDFYISALIAAGTGRHAREACLEESLGSLFDPWWPGDVEVLRAIEAPELEQKEWETEEVVGVEMAEEYSVDGHGVGAGLTDLHEGGWAGVEKVTVVEKEGAESAATGVEGISRPEKEEVERISIGHQVAFGCRLADSGIAKDYCLCRQAYCERTEA